MPQVNSNITVNYNRVTAPYSRFGTRRLQAYEITVSGISDADALYSDARWNSITYADFIAASAALGIDVEVVDTHSQQVRWPSNSIHSAILKGAGDVAEVYYTGFFYEDRAGTDDNLLSIVVMVAEDTFIDGENPDSELAGNNSRSMVDAVYNQIQEFNWQNLSVYRVDLFGSSFYDAYDPTVDDFSGPNALKSPVGSRRPSQESKTEIAQRLKRK